MTQTDSTPTQVDFYVLAQSEMTAKYMYACRIVNKAYVQGLRVYIQTDEAQQSEILDKMLWTFLQRSFVPHAIFHADVVIDGEAPEHADEAYDMARYPVLIGCVTAPHLPQPSIDLLVSLCQQAPTDYAKFVRVVELISNQEQDKALGRQRFRFYREQGIAPKTHNISA